MDNPIDFPNKKYLAFLKYKEKDYDRYIKLKRESYQRRKYYINEVLICSCGRLNTRNNMKVHTTKPIHSKPLNNTEIKIRDQWVSMYGPNNGQND